MYKYCRQGVKIKNPRPKMVFFFRARIFYGYCALSVYCLFCIM